ncbi:MAG: hypothetical protein ACTHK7_11970 [Aureliella sp.]
MKHLTKKNRWECLLYSMAMVLDETPEALTAELGHDGSAMVVPPMAPANPYDSENALLSRVGFHVHEFQHVALDRNKAFYPLQIMPASSVGGIVHLVRNRLDERWNLFHAIIRTNKGVITGTTRHGWGHAVAFENGVVYDPDGVPPYHFTIEEACDRRFYPKEVWVLK